MEESSGRDHSRAVVRQRPAPHRGAHRFDSAATALGLISTLLYGIGRICWFNFSFTKGSSSPRLP